MKRDFLTGLVLIVFCALYWLGADQIPEMKIDTGVGAQALPKALTYALAALSTLLIIQSAYNRRRAERKQQIPLHKPENANNHMRAFGMFLIGGFFLAILEYTGYVIGLFFLMAATAVYMGEKISIRLTAMFAGGAIVFWFLFEKILRVPMPEGIWMQLARSLGM